MTFARHLLNYEELPEYQLARDVSELIKSTANQMTFTKQREWLRDRILWEAGQLTATLIEGYSNNFASEWALGIGSCRNSVLMADYIFTFMQGNGILEREKAEPVLARLSELMTRLMNLSVT